MAQETETEDSAAVGTAVESAVPGTAPAAAPDPALIAACLEQTNMGEAICTCTARKAKEELTEAGQAFLLAMLQEDEEETERLRAEMSVQETMQAGMFLTRAPRECAGE
jgi:hypothetical protein